MNPLIIAAAVGAGAYYLYRKSRTAAVSIAAPLATSNPTVVLHPGNVYGGIFDQLSYAAPTPGAVEKYEDPLYECFGSRPEEVYGQPGPPLAYSSTSGPPTYRPYSIYSTSRADDFSIPNPLGYEYLGLVVNEANSRVSAMEAKIAAHAGDASTFVDQIAANSKTALIALAQQAMAAAKTPAQIATLAAAAKTTTTDVSQQINAIGLSLAQSDAASAAFSVSDLLAGPLLRAAVTASAQGIAAAATSAGAHPTGSKVFADSSYVAAAIPIIGPLAALTLKSIGNFLGARSDKNVEMCNSFVSDTLHKAYQDFVDAGLPFPLLADTVFDPTCNIPSYFAAEKWVESGSQRALVSLLQTQYTAWKAMPATALQSVIRWWYLTLVLMSDPRMQACFRAMGKDAEGGNIASDEQVMMVATPLAIAYGLDMKGFRRILWDKAQGWKSRADLLAGDGWSRNLYKAADCSGGPFAHACPPDELVGTEHYCTGAPRNAYLVQWVALCDAAFPLAAQYAAQRAARGITRGT